MDGVSKGVKHFQTKGDYFNKNSIKNVLPNSLKKTSIKDISKNSLVKKEDVSSISKEAKELGKSVATNGLTNGVSNVVSNIATGILKPVISGGITKPLPKISLSEVKEIKKVEKRTGPKVIRRPGVIFINGFSFFGDDKESGLGQMAKFIPGAENYSYNDSDKIIDSILKRPINQPILLVGHGLGGDTAVEISTELNSMKHGFREVNLLVTLDSVGFNNDIIPQNVKTNLNYIGDQGGIFNDGPNIARNTDYTVVVNELRSEGHGEMVDSKDVQYKVFEGINKILKDAVIQNNLSSSSLYNRNLLRGSLRVN